MKAFIYGKFTLGDKIIIEHLKSVLDNCDYLGEKVDLSKIVPEDNNLIIISNTNLFKIDQDKVLGYIKKDVTKPLLVLRKYNTFGTVFFKKNFEVEKISSNKAFNFAGMLYLPKKYLEALPENKKTISEVFKTVPYTDWRFYIINNKKR